MPGRYGERPLGMLRPFPEAIAAWSNDIGPAALDGNPLRRGLGFQVRLLIAMVDQSALNCLAENRRVPPLTDAELRGQQ